MCTDIRTFLKIGTRHVSARSVTAATSRSNVQSDFTTIPLSVSFQRTAGLCVFLYPLVIATFPLLHIYISVVGDRCSTITLPIFLIAYKKMCSVLAESQRVGTRSSFSFVLVELETKEPTNKVFLSYG